MRLIIVTVVFSVLLLTGCGLVSDTSNTGWFPAPWENFIATIEIPQELKAGEEATWVAKVLLPSFVSENDLVYSWDFGGGAEPDKVTALTITGKPLSSITVRMIGIPHDSAEYRCRLTITEPNGQATGGEVTYWVQPKPNHPPVIENIDVIGDMMTVSVSDADGDKVDLSISGLVGVTVYPLSVAVQTPGEAVFLFAADDIFEGPDSKVTVTADDRHGGIVVDESASIVFYWPIYWADTLYAIPLQSQVNTDTPVTIVIATGDTGSFHFMLGVGVVLDSDASYVEDTFNVGAVGGDTDDADGVWGAITSNGGFILGPDSLIQPGANPADSLGTRQRFDFNISPLGGSDVASVEGELFNFQVTYSSEGEKHIGFQEFNGVNRTYYSDLASGEPTYWGEFVEGTIIVTE